MFIAGWWDGFRVLGTTTWGITSLVVALVVLLAVLLVERRRRNSVYGHRVDWRA